MAPPAKRRKRNVVVSSSSSSDSEDKNDDDILSSTPPPNPKRVETKDRVSSTVQRNVASSLKRPAVKASSKQPSNAAPKNPPKQKTAKKAITISPRNSSQKTGNANGKYADIQTLFAKQVATEGELGSRLPRKTLSRTSSFAEDDDDPISDDDVRPSRSQISMVAAMAKKRKQGTLPSAAENHVSSAPPKFLKPAPKEVKLDDDTRPWADRFGPTSLEELAVHKRKVSDVRTWLEAVMQGALRQRLLILKGAAGVGKTTTLQLLAKEMNCEVLEWRNADSSIASSDGFLSISAQFEEFMGRGGKFGQLDVFSSASKTSTESITNPAERRNQIILIEEFPSTFNRSSTALQSFRSTILQYLAANTPSLSSIYGGNQETSLPITPVVMVISETLLTTTSASADSFTAHRLLGPEILQHPSINVIEFNAVAPTILAKALDLVIQKEARKSGRRKTPGPLVLKTLGEVGDVRSAVGSLEFLCIRGDSADWGGKISFAKTKKSKTEPEMTQVEKESLELVTRREASLGIFHAVGKVMYNKRDEIDSTSPSAAVERLPEYLSLSERPRKSQVMVDTLIDETGTDTQTFIDTLHENYILSCDAPPTSIDFSSIDHVNSCIDALSDSDLLTPSWDGSFNSTGLGGGIGGQGSGGDILRQDEMCFQIAVRGIVFALPYPVKRQAPTASGFRTGNRGDAHKMFYPTSLKLWRLREEIESTIDTWVTRLKKGETSLSQSGITAGAKAFVKPKPGSVETWGNNNPSFSSTASSSRQQGSQKNAKKEEDAPIPLLATGSSARKEMLLERLPYMVQIARARNTPTTSYSSLRIRELEKVTLFSGIGNANDEVPDEGDGDTRVVEEWATDKAGDEFSGNNGNGRKEKGKMGILRKGGVLGSSEVGMGVVEEVEKLVLSDDDIEDY